MKSLLIFRAEYFTVTPSSLSGKARFMPTDQFFESQGNAWNPDISTANSGVQSKGLD
jgi:hypothetical protein